MPESGPFGSVRGVSGNGYSYRDSCPVILLGFIACLASCLAPCYRAGARPLPGTTPP